MPLGEKGPRIRLLLNIYWLCHFVQPDVASRALDIGCAVGRSTFELAVHFENVVGIDFSHAFVDRCNELKECGQSPFCLPGEGDIMEKGMAEVSKEIVRFHICDRACKN